MKCEACGGDGLIEYGAYRGTEDDTDTRPCQLCGGPRPVFNIPAGTSIDAAVEALKKLGRAGLELTTPPSAKAILSTANAAEETLRLMSSENGVREVVTEWPDSDYGPIPVPQHEHEWKDEVAAGNVTYDCQGCPAVAICDRDDGSVVTGPTQISEVDKLALSSRTVTRYPRYRAQSPADIAREYAQRLNTENERRQREAEQHVHAWDSGKIVNGYNGGQSDRRVDVHCMLCKCVLVFDTGGALCGGNVEELQGFELDELAARVKKVVKRRL